MWCAFQLRKKKHCTSASYRSYKLDLWSIPIKSFGTWNQGTDVNLFPRIMIRLRYYDILTIWRRYVRFEYAYMTISILTSTAAGQFLYVFSVLKFQADLLRSFGQNLSPLLYHGKIYIIHNNKKNNHLRLSNRCVWSASSLDLLRGHGVLCLS